MFYKEIIDSHYKMRAVAHVHLLMKINYIKLYDINIDISLLLLLNKVRAILIRNVLFSYQFRMYCIMKIIISKKKKKCCQAINRD